MATIDLGLVRGQNGTDGEDGVSPIITVSDIEGGHRVTITDAKGTQSFDVMNGEDGNVENVDKLFASGSDIYTWHYANDDDGIGLQFGKGTGYEFNITRRKNDINKLRYWLNGPDIKYSGMFYTTDYKPTASDVGAVPSSRVNQDLNTTSAATFKSVTADVVYGAVFME